MELVLYEMIDKRFEEFLSYDVPLKLIFIEGDIESYGRECLDIHLDRVGTVSVNTLNKLLNSFSRIPKNDKDSLKKLYLDFIKKACKHDSNRFDTVNNNQDSEDDETENYSNQDEFQFITERDENEEIHQEAETITEERINRLEELTSIANLSEIEVFALNYIKDRSSVKHPLLELFTINGIIQIANRAAYKLYCIIKA